MSEGLKGQASEAEIARYRALKQQGDAAPARLHSEGDAQLATPRTISGEKILWRETIVGGGQMSRIVRAGQVLRLVNSSGKSTPALIALNADLPSERLNTGDTAKIQWNAYLGKGKLIYSEMGRVLFSIVEDTCGYHDMIAGASTAASVAARYPEDVYRTNARDNFVLALGKFGYGRREVVPCISFFTGIDVVEGSKLKWLGDVSKPGDFVDLRAEMNVLVALSNTAHPFDARGSEDAIDALVWQGPPAAPDDPSRTSCEEAQRAFINTDDFLIQIGARA